MQNVQIFLSTKCSYSVFVLILRKPILRATNRNRNNRKDVSLATFTQLLLYCELNTEYLTVAETIETISIYDDLGGNIDEAVNLHVLRYPERSCPSRRLFYRVVTKFSQDGSV